MNDILNDKFTLNDDLIKWKKLYNINCSGYKFNDLYSLLFDDYRMDRKSIQYSIQYSIQLQKIIESLLKCSIKPQILIKSLFECSYLCLFIKFIDGLLQFNPFQPESGNNMSRFNSYHSGILYGKFLNIYDIYYEPY